MARFVRVLIFLPEILLLCCFAWAVLFSFFFIEFFVRFCVWLVKDIASLIVGGWALNRTLWLNSASGRRLRNPSIEQHALWDRWLDGI
jgi:hypothetical protein